MAGTKGQPLLVTPQEARSPETILLPRGPESSSAGPQPHPSTTAPPPHIPFTKTPGTSPDPPTAPALRSAAQAQQQHRGPHLPMCRATHCASPCLVKSCP